MLNYQATKTILIEILSSRNDSEVTNLFDHMLFKPIIYYGGPFFEYIMERSINTLSAVAGL